MKKLLWGLLLPVVLFSFAHSIKAVTTNRIVIPVATPTPTPNRIQKINLDIATPTPTVTRQLQTIVTPALRKTIQLNQPNPVITTAQDAGDLSIDKNKIGQEKMLNPQPEPPIFDSLEVKKTEKVSNFTWPNRGILQTLSSKVEFTSDGAEVQIPKKLSGGTETVKLLIKPEFTISGNRTFLSDNGKQIELRSLPSAMYQKLDSVFSKHHIKSVDDFTLGMVDGKAVYWITVDEPIKIVGLFPSTMKVKLSIADQDGKVSISNKPWYASISQEQVKLISELSLLPNVVVKDLRYEPASFSAGQEVKAIVTIANEGLGYALGFPDSVLPGGSGGPMASLILPDENNFVYSWYPVIIALAPGEEWTFDYFTPLVAKCGRNIRVEVASTDASHLDETTKEDNVITGQMQCQP
jgi:hypothetical protein